MKMASEKAEDFLEARRPPECLDEAQSAAVGVPEERDEPTKTETGTTSTSSPPGPEEQSVLSMPCLMKELRRDSQESQQASTGSDKPASRHVYESDSSNPCMLSPSSSGHLADSDTLSSGEDAATAVGADSMEAAADPGHAADTQPATAAPGGRKSRRSRSESEMPPNAKAAKKNRSQPAVAAAAAGGQEKQTNGKLGKVKGHRSQKHKERMRLLRQKREAAARKKYNLLQDSSTSDSELTCDSSSSSSDDDDDDTSGGSKTIKTEIPDGPPVLGHYDLSDSDSNRDSLSAEAVRPSVIRQELKALRGRDPAARSGWIPALSAMADPGATNLSQQMNLGSSDSEVEIVGVQEKAARCGHPCGGVIKTLSSVEPLNNSNQSQLWTSLSSPPEVVDLTLDEDVGHKFLL